jgi:preprotein translocase subunit SecG
LLSFVLYALFIIACLVLVLAVLLQPGKASAGDLFTSSVSSTAFGPRGTQTLLAKITIGAAIAFMLVALMISMGIGGPRSVMSSTDTGPAPQTTPQAAMTPLPQQPATDPAPATTQQEGATAPPAANTGAAPSEPAASPQGANAPEQK